MGLFYTVHIGGLLMVSFVL